MPASPPRPAPRKPPTHPTFLLRRLDQQMPPEQARRHLLHEAWQSPHPRVLVHRQMPNPDPHLAETPEHPPCLPRRDGEGAGTLRPIGTAMHEVLRPEVFPAFTEEIAVVDVPHLACVIAAYP